MFKLSVTTSTKCINQIAKRFKIDMMRPPPKKKTPLLEYPKFDVTLRHLFPERVTSRLLANNNYYLKSAKYYSGANYYAHERTPYVLNATGAYEKFVYSECHGTHEQVQQFFKYTATLWQDLDFYPLVFVLPLGVLNRMERDEGVQVQVVKERFLKVIPTNAVMLDFKGVRRDNFPAHVSQVLQHFPKPKSNLVDLSDVQHLIDIKGQNFDPIRRIQ